MESRMDKYYKENLVNFERTKRNANLYKEVYEDYNTMEKLPVSDNVNEIDLNNLKQMVDGREEYQKLKDYNIVNNQANNPTENDEMTKEQKRIYDINELLEQARKENSNSKKEEELIKPTPNFLVTLEQSVITKEEVIETDKETITKEIKYETKKISDDPEISQILGTTSLPLDILKDLQPTKDTLISTPMIEKEEEEQKNKTFYSGSYNFSKKDFVEEDNDFVIKEKKHIGLKIFFLIIGLSILGIITFYLLKHFNIIKL